jgi:hypothetical protein
MQSGNRNDMGPPQTPRFGAVSHLETATPTKCKTIMPPRAAHFGNVPTKSADFAEVKFHAIGNEKTFSPTARHRRPNCSRELLGATITAGSTQWP